MFLSCIMHQLALQCNISVFLYKKKVCVQSQILSTLDENQMTVRMNFVLLPS